MGHNLHKRSIQVVIKKLFNIEEFFDRNYIEIILLLLELF